MTEHPNKIVYALLDAETDLQARAWVFPSSRDVAILDKRYDRMVSVTLPQLRAILAAAEKAFEDDLPEPERVAADEEVRRALDVLAAIRADAGGFTAPTFAAKADARAECDRRNAAAGAELFEVVDSSLGFRVVPIEAAPEPTRAERLKLLDEDIDLHATACGDQLAWVEKLDDESTELLEAIGSPRKGGLQSIVERGSPRFVYDGDSVTAKVNAWRKRGVVEFWYPSRGVEVNLTDLGRSAVAYHAKVKARAELLLAESA